MKFPTLYHKTKTGGLAQWRVWTEDDTIFVEYGQVGGKLQVSPGKVAVPKNEGKANSTTASEQANAEAQSMHTSKLDRKYSLTPEAAETPKLIPMLAKDFHKHKKNLIYPVMVQPKLDGFRCLARRVGGKIILTSRAQKEFSLPHIEKSLLKVMRPGEFLDGELYCHGIPFQTVASWIKKSRPETLQIRYNIYDAPEITEYFMMDPTNEQRDLYLGNALSFKIQQEKTVDYLDIVETGYANSEAEVMEWQSRFLLDGYEGAIVRIPSGEYTFNYRSSDLLKVKDFDDAEFKIVGGNPGLGKFTGMCIFECLTEDGKLFNVMPRGTAAERTKYLTNLKQYIGKDLKVKYFGRSLDNIPRFPVGLGIREDFDK